jgi:hypothetical protein
MTVTIDDIVNAIGDFTYLSCQSKTESEAPITNTSANILYNGSSRRQGNLTSYFATATIQITNDEAAYSISLSDDQKKMAYAYLCQFYFERKFKDWNAKSIRSGDDSITRESGLAGNGAWLNYLDVFERASSSSLDSTIERHTDYTNYPEEWRNIQITDSIDTDPIPNET